MNAAAQPPVSITARVSDDTATFVVEPDGQVREACTSRSEIADEPFTACVTRAILARRFPRSVGGGRVTVAYPFVFNPGD